MRKLKKRLAALGVSLAVMATSMMSLGASAYTYYDDWGPRYFTPQSGEFYALDSGVCVRKLYWSEASIRRIQQEQMAQDYIPQYYTSEFEFRPKDYHPYQIWSSFKSFSSNMPSAYKECEFELWGNDVTIGCKRTAQSIAGKEYYGYLNFNELSNPPFYPLYTFESEYGLNPTNSEDSIPQYSEVYNLGTTMFNNIYSW